MIDFPLRIVYEERFQKEFVPCVMKCEDLGDFSCERNYLIKIYA